MPKLIADLAIMLLTAALVAVVFKRIKQPLVLGYILVGFLVGPFMPYFFTVEDSASIETWSEIGIIILMFGLGLEFNLHKLVRVGKTAVITAMVEVFGMLVIGYLLGRMLGWGMMDSIFLGGMLSMSSTTIIIKAFDDLEVPKKGYSELVFGTLVIQDIAGIFMMVILSTVSVSKNITGGALALQLGVMVLYLALWLIIGIFVLPSVLRTATRFMNDEVLMLMSLGICFAMVLLADRLGFSTALGAFLAGSLLAGTVQAEKIEGLTSGIKDLFGAIFFLSVGMMIDPAILVKHIVPIIIISIATIVFKLVISALGVLFSGHSLKEAIQSGCALAQIGEFAFMIAALGMNLGVIKDYVYPIIVAVSVITTLTTPFFIKGSPKIYELVRKMVPEGLISKISSYTDEEPVEREENDSDWSNYIKRYIRVTAIYGILMAGASLLVLLLVYPGLLKTELNPAIVKALCTLGVLAGVGIFVRPMLDLHSSEYTLLWVKDRKNRMPLIALTVTRFLLILFIVFFPLQKILGVPSILLLILIALAILIIYKSGWLSSAYISAEARFMANLNERNLQNLEEDDTEWLDEKLFVERLESRDGVSRLLTGRTLQQLNWGKRFNINVFKIEKGKKVTVMPDGDFLMDDGDVLYLLGREEDIKALRLSIDRNFDESKDLHIISLRDFINQQMGEATDIYDYALPVDRDSMLYGKSIKDSGLRENYDCMIIGIQRDKLPILLPDTNMVMQPGDRVWILGSTNMAEKLLVEGE